MSLVQKIRDRHAERTACYEAWQPDADYDTKQCPHEEGMHEDIKQLLSVVDELTPWVMEMFDLEFAATHDVCSPSCRHEQLHLALMKVIPYKEPV